MKDIYLSILFIIMSIVLLFSDYNRIQKNQSINGKFIDEFQLNKLYKSTRLVFSFTQVLLLLSMAGAFLVHPIDWRLFCVLMGIFILSHVFYIILLSLNQAYFGKKEHTNKLGNFFLLFCWSFNFYSEIGYEKNLYRLIISALIILIPLTNILAIYINRFVEHRQSSESLEIE